ncbi:MAG: DUF4926 domain-containing protein [Clostridia bacterium]|nr:DUF4926 domain-containing protein [Clostridia bacterium]
MFKEYDVIHAKRRISKNVKRGTVGTILLILSNENKVYEVEFLDKAGNTLDVLSVTSKDIAKTRK